MRHNLLPIVLSALVALLPVPLLLYLGYTTTKDDTERELVQSAEAVVRSAERLVDHAVERLTMLYRLIGQPCTDEIVSRLGSAVYESPYIREIALFDRDFTLYCTNFGPTSLRVYDDLAEAPPKSGIFVRSTWTTVRNSRSVIVNVRELDGTGMNALLSPEHFLLQIEGSPLRDVTHATLRLADGAMIGQVIGGRISSGNEDAFPARQVTGRYGLQASVRVSREYVAARLARQLPRYLGAGVLLAVLSGLLFWHLWRRRLSPEAELRTALRRGEFEIHYQPVMDVTTNRCIGVEALLRWRHPVQGLILPDRFIHMAEDTGLIIPITRWVLERVKKDLGSAFRENPELHVAVNLVAAHFTSDEIVRDIRRIFPTRDFPPSRLVLEATERQIIDDRDGTARRIMRELQDLGCTIALDDFGSGTNGFSYLEKFKMDVLKIDKAFVDSVGTEAINRPVLDAIIDLGNKLGMKLLAEGVEDEHQLAYLRSRGVEMAQGNSFAKPMTTEDLERFIRRNRQEQERRQKMRVTGR